MGEGICLYSAADFDPGVALVSETEDTSEALGGEVADFKEGQGRGLESRYKL